MVTTLADPAVRQKLSEQSYEVGPRQEQTPEYLRLIERGALRSFLGETQYVSLAFGGTAAFFGYWIGQFIGRYLAVWPIRRYIKTV